MTDPSRNGRGEGRSSEGHVILVEDDPAVRGVLSLLLQSEGWRVMEASDGDAALRLARSMTADVMVTDLRMPGMSGIELARRLSESEDLAGLPIVAITSDSSGLRDAAIASGWFTVVLTKPLSPEPFLDALRDASRSESRPTGP